MATISGVSGRERNVGVWDNLEFRINKIQRCEKERKQIFRSTPEYSSINFKYLTLHIVFTELF